ncbi:hypothetical protein GIB67_021524 [Kingdonia uniflora]|uniref:SNARE-interacting protein KEULE n=1 Tax=Kingdonia uniflora TaxID=39325 RepID=A0A7J7L9U5_9MAGN|nr:hypothetical protein GIB67_021524 [Kingdonia uniflora]
MNLEYFVIDSQGFITDNERVLEDLIGDNMESSHHYDPCVNLMATRIASVFASLRELPCIRYRAAKSLDASTVTTLLDFVPTKLAASVWNHLTNYKSSIPSFSQTETCELLILDRSVDEIAPVIHEWTYDCMCHDLLNMDGNIYDQEDPSKIGCTFEKKQVLLDDHDPVWLELRHMHIADVSERLYEKMTNFISKNKAAQMQDCSSKISTRNLKRIVQALPQYSDQIERLSRHILIAEKIYKSIKELGLREYGQLEEDLVFGDAGIKDLTNFLMTKQDTTSECKLRLLMIYAAIFPENFEGEEGLKLMKVVGNPFTSMLFKVVMLPAAIFSFKSFIRIMALYLLVLTFSLASLSPEDIKAVNNMRFLKGSSNTKKTSAVGFSLKFGVQEKKPAARNYRGGKEDTWQLTRFCPKIEDLVEKLCKGELSQSDYPCVNDPSPSVHGTGGSLVPVVHSMRSRRTATWAHSRIYDDAYASDSILKHASRMSRRIFVFIIGGATRSELRVCHKLTEKMNREIVLGSTSLDDPQIFIKKLKVAGETSVIKEFPTDIDPSLRISSNSDPTPVENVETKKRRKRLMKLVNTLKSKLKHQSLI